MSNSLRPIAAAFGHLLVWCCFATAQQGDPPSVPSDGKLAKPQAADGKLAKPQAAAVEESRPSVYYLPDKQGNLQPVLDFKYQDFVELYRLKNQLERRDEPPRYSLQRMTATGTAGEGYAELSIQFQVLVRDDDWVRVPLRLDQGLLRGAVKYKGPGEQFVHYEGGSEGYVCWVRGKADAQHEITLALLVPLTAVGDETRLKLFTPRATASELKLTAPLAGAVGTVSEGATLLPSAAANNAATEFSVVGLGGDFQLAWHKSNPRVAETPLVLEAACTVLTRLDGRSISAEATLSVRSYGAAFDRFIVRLPPGAELSAGNPSGYLVTPVEAEGKQKGQQRLVEVRLLKKTAGPVEVRLACRRNYDPVKNQSWCELAGFEVVGAARQWGTTAVAAAGDWQVLWGTSSDVRQTDQLPDSLRKDDVVAAFEYSTQPYALSARLTPRKTRVGVDPKYVLLVERDEVRLEGNLTYTIRGAKTATLDVAIPGWELDEVGPDNLVAVDGVAQNGDDIAIPLVRPSSGTFELQLRAHYAIKDLSQHVAQPPPAVQNRPGQPGAAVPQAGIGIGSKAGTKSFRVSLPQPQAGSIGSASVAVVAADNVELTPNNRGIEGLVRQPIAPPLPKLPERQQEPLYYRGAGGAAVFAADFRVHAQRITVEVASQVTLGQRTAEVEQKLSYSIAYEPVDRLTIAVPRALAAAKRIQVLYDGKPLLPIAAADELTGDDATAPVSMRVALPSPRIGACELVLQYSAAVAEPTSRQPSTLALPLPMPEDGQLLANSLTVKAARNTRVSLRKEGAWTVVAPEVGASGGQNDLRLTAAKTVHRVDLDLRWETNDAAGATIVDRAWVQSWLTSSSRQDRATYQLTTNRKEIEVVFPAGAEASQAEVLVDGKRVEGRAIAENRLLAPLPGQRESRRVVIELRYHFLGPRPPRGALRLDFPQMGPNAWVRRLYWQLILPANEHVVANPAGFTGEFAWGWQGYFWGRQPLLDQAQLESWVGATPRAALPERLNLYLFSTLGNVEQAEVHTAARTWIVLWASGAALVAGLLLIYVPASRHPATLLVLGIVLLATGLVAPEPTLLLAQAASLGLALALLAGLLERGLTGRRRQTTVRKEPSSALVEWGPPHMPLAPPPIGGRASTDAMPSVQPQPTGNADR